jgi:hypothetical protein
MKSPRKAKTECQPSKPLGRREKQESGEERGIGNEGIRYNSSAVADPRRRLLELHFFLTHSKPGSSTKSETNQSNDVSSDCREATTATAIARSNR